MSIRASSPVRLLLFDAFDTLVTPRLPIHIQYAQEAQKFGIKVEPESIKNAFKPAFKHVSAKSSSLGDPLAWWSSIIQETLNRAVTTESDRDQGGLLETRLQEISDALPALAPSVMERFSGREGYMAYPDVIPSLTQLSDNPDTRHVKIGVVSNTDGRMHSVLSDLGILDFIQRSGGTVTLSQEVGMSKPDKRIFERACRDAGVSQIDGGWKGVVMVGDELDADYWGAVNAGLEARLLRRPGEWSDGAKRTSDEKLDGVSVISSLNVLVEQVLQRSTGAT